eukprot:1832733-Prymnesium_polylepis.1
MAESAAPSAKRATSFAGMAESAPTERTPLAAAVPKSCKRQSTCTVKGLSAAESVHRDRQMLDPSVASQVISPTEFVHSPTIHRTRDMSSDRAVRTYARVCE